MWDTGSQMTDDLLRADGLYCKAPKHKYIYSVFAQGHVPTANSVPAFSGVVVFTQGRILVRAIKFHWRTRPYSRALFGQGLRLATRTRYRLQVAARSAYCGFAICYLVRVDVLTCESTISQGVVNLYGAQSRQY